MGKLAFTRVQQAAFIYFNGFVCFLKSFMSKHGILNSGKSLVS